MTFIVSAAATAASTSALAGVIGGTAAGALGGAAAGAAGGAALGAGVAAIQGKDPGQGALMGAATGAIGGGIGGGVIGNGVNAATTGVGQTAAQGVTQGAGETAGETAGQVAAPTAGQVAAPTAGQGINAVGTDVGSGVVAPTTDTAFTGGNITSDFTPVATSNPGQGINAVGTDVGSGVVAPTTDTAYTGLDMAPQTPLQQGIAAGKANTGAAMNWVGDNKIETAIGGAALLPMLGGSSPNNGTEYTPDNTNYLSSNFHRTEPQGVVPTSGYASGGILSGMPGAGLAKDFVGKISPSLGNDLFGNSTPTNAMNPIVARSMQQAQQAQQAQGPQQQIQAQGPQQAMQGPAPAPVQQAANGGIMHAQDSNLGGYAHGGIPRLLRGPGDGVSDDIPATIAGKQPARLADGEFVIPARIVSELGNGSTEAGGRVLQAMVDRIQARRSKTVGKGKVAVDSKAKKGLPV